MQGVKINSQINVACSLNDAQLSNLSRNISLFKEPGMRSTDGMMSRTLEQEIILFQRQCASSLLTKIF